jgi:hypothetical protein
MGQVLPCHQRVRAGRSQRRNRMLVGLALLRLTKVDSLWTILEVAALHNDLPQPPREAPPGAIT